VVSDTTYPGYEEVPRHIMQGYTVLVRECLACRNASALAWKILEEGADAFLTVPDVAAEKTVDILGRGLNGDPPILTQPSGAAGLTGLMAALFESTLAEPLSLGKDSRVLIIGSEGPAKKRKTHERST
jgi:threonine dehydratase